MFASIFIGIFITSILNGIIIVILRREQYETELGFLSIVIIYFIGEILYFFTFNLSTEKFFNLSLSKFLFTTSLICRVFSTTVWSSIYSFELNKSSKVRFIPLLGYLLLFGIIISLIFAPNSFDIFIFSENYNYPITFIPLITFLFIFYIFSLLTLWITQVKRFKEFGDRHLAQIYNYYVVLFSISNLLYILYLVLMNDLLRFLHLLLYLITFPLFIFIIIRKPSLFLVFTNRIYDFIIFHKSGILLYSYNFQTGKEVDELSLKGSILIGISHIMTNLSNIENQLTHIKMKDKAIVFNFDKKLGYAVLLVAKHKNSVLETTITKFMNEFSHVYEEKLKSLTRLIDISGFEDTIKIIFQYFKHYLLK